MKRKPTNLGTAQTASHKQMPIFAALNRTESDGKSHDVILAHASCTSCDFDGLLPALASGTGSCPACGSDTQAVRKDKATVTVQASIVATETTYVGTCPSCGSENRVSDPSVVTSSVHCVVCAEEFDVVMEGDPEEDVEEDAYLDAGEDDAYPDAGEDDPEGMAQADAEAQAEAEAEYEEDPDAMSQDDGMGSAPEDEGEAAYMMGDEEDDLLADGASSDVFARLAEVRLARVDADLDRATRAVQIASEALMVAQPDSADAIEAQTDASIEALQTVASAQRVKIQKTFRTLDRQLQRGDVKALAAIASVYANADTTPAPAVTPEEMPTPGAAQLGPNGEELTDEEKAKLAAEADAAAAANGGAGGATAVVDDVPGVAMAHVKVDLLKQALLANKGKPLSTYAHLAQASVAGMPPLVMLMAGNSVVATLRKEKASVGMQPRFASLDQLTKAFFNAANDGAPLADKGFADSFGLEPVTVQVPVNQAIQVKLDEASTAQQAEYDRRLQELPQQFMESVDTTLAGLTKGFFALPPEADLIKALASRFEAAGCRGAAAIVASVFNEKAGPFFDGVLTQTEALLEKPEPVRAEIADVIKASAGTAGFATSALSSLPQRAATAGQVVTSSANLANANSMPSARTHGGAIPGLISIR
jgi:hypothetical protein